jgi:hypothetical protein
MFLRIIQQTDVAVTDLYSEDTLFESRTGYQLTNLVNNSTEQSSS